MTAVVEREPCPKCGAPRGDTACPRCGLAVANMQAFSDKRDADVAPAVRAAWEHLLATWDDEARHLGFLALVVDKDAFAWAAAQYRGKKPDPRAEAMLDRIRRAAEARLAATASARPAPKSVFSSVKLLLGGAVVMILALLLILSFMRGKKEVDKRTLAPPPAAAPGQKVR